MRESGEPVFAPEEKEAVTVRGGTARGVIKIQPEPYIEAARDERRARELLEAMAQQTPEQDRAIAHLEQELLTMHELSRTPVRQHRSYRLSGSDEYKDFKYTAANRLTVESMFGDPIHVIEKSTHVLETQEQDMRNRGFGDQYAIENHEVLRREWLAYMIDRALGLGMVPTTVLRNTSEGIASWQAWKHDTVAAIEVDWDSIPSTNEELQRLALTQIAVFNVDAHDANVLIAQTDANGTPTKMWQIDNGFSNVLKASTIRAHAWRSLEKKLVHEPLLARIDVFLNDQNLQNTLRACFDLAFGVEHAQDYWQAFLVRITALTDSGFFPSLDQITNSQHDAFSTARTYASKPPSKGY